jgi:probable F420-dependent oxidoreductase
MYPPLRVGVLLQPQLITYPAYAQAVRQAESLGVDTIWDWDHFFPPYRRKHTGEHFEAWTLLSAMAGLTRRAEIGCLVSCNDYRNPNLLANMAKTVDHLSGGRLILGIGAGWNEAEYRAYGYPFASAARRLQALEQSLVQIKQRWQSEQPPPLRNPIPILAGGVGEQITLRITARYADIWNGFGPPDRFQHKWAVLDEWCRQIGRPPEAIERSVLTIAYAARTLDRYLAAGARHVIVSMGEPWNFTILERLVRWRDDRQ